MTAGRRVCPQAGGAGTKTELTTDFLAQRSRNQKRKSRQKNGGRKIFNAENIEERRETQRRLTAQYVK